MSDTEKATIIIWVKNTCFYSFGVSILSKELCSPKSLMMYLEIFGVIASVKHICYVLNKETVIIFLQRWTGC